MVAAAVVGSAVVGGVASNMAASKQANAAGKAADQSAEAAAQMRSDLAPYNQAGQNALNPLLYAMGYQLDSSGNIQHNWEHPLQQQFQFDPSQLDKTPGYQFALQQGLKSTNNSLAAQGLGLSGAQAKGLSQYATGLADQTYGEQYNRAMSTFSSNQSTAQNRVNNLSGLVNMGQNSAAQTGQAAIGAANNSGNFLTQQGNAQASGFMGMANAANTGVGNYLTYNALYPKAQPSFGSQVGTMLSS
jgi:hypothetical protein